MIVLDPAIVSQLAALFSMEATQVAALIEGFDELTRATRHVPPPRGLVGREATTRHGPPGVVRHVVTDDRGATYVWLERSGGALEAVPIEWLRLKPWESKP